MREICMYCGKITKEGPTWPMGISHGCCEECYQEQLAKLRSPHVVVKDEPKKSENEE